MPNFKIQARRLATTAGAGFGNDVTGTDTIAYSSQQAVVLGIQGQPALSVIDHHQEALTTKPVGIDDVATVNSVDGLTFICRDQPTAPANIRIASRAVSIFQRARHWHSQRALSVSEG